MISFLLSTAVAVVSEKVKDNADKIKEKTGVVLDKTCVIKEKAGTVMKKTASGIMEKTGVVAEKTGTIIKDKAENVRTMKFDIEPARRIVVKMYDRTKAWVEIKTRARKMDRRINSLVVFAQTDAYLDEAEFVLHANDKDGNHITDISVTMPKSTGIKVGDSVKL